MLVSLIRVVVVLHQAWTYTLPDCAHANVIRLQLRIDELRRQSPEDWLGAFSVMQVDETLCSSLLGAKLRLSWRSSEPLAVGQIVNGLVKLRPLWGSANSAGFNYQRWLIAKGYIATGYIKQGELAAKRPAKRTADYIRSSLFDPRLLHASSLLALASGEQSSLSTAHWARLRRTGTIHLFVISGLHVALVGGWLYVLALGVFRCASLLTPMPLASQQWAMLLSLCGIGGYAWLSGLNPPVMRASVMAGLVTLGMMMLRRAEPVRVLMVTFGLALIAQPLSSLQQGFWLSYTAVAVLCWGVVGYQRRLGNVTTFLRAQIVLFVSMAPLLGVLVGAIPLLSIPANLLAVPVVTLVTLPSLLLGLALTKVSGDISLWLLTVADMSLHTVFNILDWLLMTAPVQFQSFGYFPPATALTSAAAALLCSVPSNHGLRFMGLLALLPMMLVVREPLPVGEFRLQVLDVGQGSAAIIDTRAHRMVIDAGPRLAERFDAGEAIVIPALRSSGVDNVDLLLLTHSDSDHAGGQQAILNRYPNAQQIVSPQHCGHGETWIRDGIRFTTLQHQTGLNRNDRSCTLLVENKSQSVYLSGDIGAAAEHSLVEHLPQGLSVLIAPHHGSQTSSSSLFTRHTRPRWVIHSAGRFSRYGHPHPTVVRRYDLECAEQLITGTVGGIAWNSMLPHQVVSQRLGLQTLDSSPEPRLRAESGCVKNLTVPSARQR